MAEPGPLCIYEKRDPHIAIINSTARRKRTPSVEISIGRSTRLGTKPRKTTTSGASS